MPQMYRFAPLFAVDIAPQFVDARVINAAARFPPGPGAHLEPEIEASPNAKRVQPGPIEPRSPEQSIKPKLSAQGAVSLCHHTTDTQACPEAQSALAGLFTALAEHADASVRIQRTAGQERSLIGDGDRRHLQARRAFVDRKQAEVSGDFLAMRAVATGDAQTRRVREDACRHRDDCESAAMSYVTDDHRPIDMGSETPCPGPCRARETYNDGRNS